MENNIRKNVPTCSTLKEIKEKIEQMKAASILIHFITNPRRRQWHPTPVLLSGKSMDRGAWWATVHGVARVGHNLAIKLPL